MTEIEILESEQWEEWKKAVAHFIQLNFNCEANKEIDYHG